MPTLSGTVTDASFAYTAKLVRAYRFDTGAYVGAALSDPTTGAWSIATADTTKHFVVAHDAVADPHWNNVVLAMRMDNLTDLKGHTASHSGTSITTGQKFGTGCVFSPYSIGSALVVDSASDLNLAGSDFTIEFFYKRGAYTGYGNSFAKGHSGSSNEEFRLTLNGDGGAVSIQLYNDGVSAVINVARTTSLSENVWHHIALARSGSALKLFVDGTQAGADISYSGTIYAGTGTLRVGNVSADSYAGNAYFDDVRITKGVARYTSNFATPTATFISAPTPGAVNAVSYDLLTPV